MATEQTVSVRCIVPIRWMGQATTAGQVLAMPPHVARAQCGAGRVAYVNPADMVQVTRAVTPARVGLAAPAARGG